MNKIDAKHVNFFYGDFQALKDISMTIEEKAVVAFIGPSGCGKSTFLRLFNRMNDLIPGSRLEGEILIDGRNIYDKSVQVDELRKNVGNGIPASQSVSEEHFRECGLWASGKWGER